MVGNTKAKILEESLKLFSEKGFDSVSMSQIADSVGIKAPSIYKHFPSKKSILDAIIDETFSRYAQFAELNGLNGSDPGRDAEVYGSMDEEGLCDLALRTVHLFKDDPFLGSFRRMIAIDRYRDPAMSDIYRRFFIDVPLNYQSGLFAGIFPGHDSRVLAMRFYLPVLHLLELNDIGQLDDDDLDACIIDLTGGFYRDMASLTRRCDCGSGIKEM